MEFVSIFMSTNLSMFHRDLKWLLSNATNNINQIAKATNTTGVIYKKDIDYMREKIEKLAKEIWDIHSLLLRK